MRHFLASSPVAALPRGMSAAASRSGLVTSSGLALRAETRLPRTDAGAITLAAVAGATDEHRVMAAGAVVTSSGRFHRS
jgi:hypothetical protein